MAVKSNLRWVKTPWDLILWTGEKNGSGRHCASHRSLVDGRGVPLSLVVVGANRHGAKMSFRNVAQVAAVLGGKVVEQTGAEEETITENLCADKAYDSDKARAEMESHGYVPHVRSRGEEIESKARNPDYKARRWVIELSHIRKCFSRVGTTCSES